jgi:glucose-1-phosphate cytidylyltransferase
MKAVILAGGLGSRLSEETEVRPKPMVEVGGKPLLWHLLKIYSAFGINEFIICLGYRGYVIKEYFANYAMHNSDITFDLGSGETIVHRRQPDAWRVTLVDTGLATMTGGRLKRIKPYLDDTFCMTYGDGLSDVDIGALIAFHNKKKRIATVTGVIPPGRFGVLDLAGDRVKMIHEKPKNESGIINGGFFVLEPEALDFVAGDEIFWEREPLEQLALAGQLSCFLHEGFWKPMDTLRDRSLLEDLWAKGNPPWMKHVRKAERKGGDPRKAPRRK